MSNINRRQFLQHSTVALAASVTTLAKAAPSERLQVGCIGVAGRAGSLVHGFAALKECDVTRLCDIDAKRLSTAVAAIEKRAGKKPAADTDFRKLIDDPALDIIVVGTPD